MTLGRAIRTALLIISVLMFMVSAFGQQVRYFPDFSTGFGNLTTNGGARQQACTWAACSTDPAYPVTRVLALTDGFGGQGTFRPAPASAWFNLQQPLRLGFTTYFKFQFRNASTPFSCCTPGDGFAFVVQNAASTDTTYGANGKGRLQAVGVGNGGVGYAGIPNSLAVEFDTVLSPNAANPWDPNGNHVAVQSCGTRTNGPVHLPGVYTIGSNTNVTSCLFSPAAINTTIPHIGVNCGSKSCADGSTHEVVIDYVQSGTPGAVGTLKVWIDPTFYCSPSGDCTHQPAPGVQPSINIPYAINAATTGLSLNPDANGNNSLGYVGFTAAQTSKPQAIDILAWEFTPHSITAVAQPIPNYPGTATFPYGGHIFEITWYQGFTQPDPNNPIFANVVATPWNQQDFYSQRLRNSHFSSEQCIIYSQTGTNCIVYSVSCQQNVNGVMKTVPCPVDTNPADACTAKGTEPACITFKTAYYTTSSVCAGNADGLSTDPIGSNNWRSYFFEFIPAGFDSGTVQKKGTTSDFVATYVPGGPCTP